MTILGAHIRGDDPLGEARARGAEIVQFFLGDPQSWKKAPPRDDAAELAASSLPMYVHAPYLVNVVSPNNRIRIPSRKILEHTIAGAEEIGSAGIIVHGGHVTDDEAIEDGFPRWRKALSSSRPTFRSSSRTRREETTPRPADWMPSAVCGMRLAISVLDSVSTPAMPGRAVSHSKGLWAG